MRKTYNLSDPGVEDLLYEVESVRRFAGLRLSGPLPDETTILNFRHLLETQGLGMGLFEEINAHLASLGHRLKTGTIVDASIIDAPSSTKNRRGELAGSHDLGELYAEVHCSHGDREVVEEYYRVYRSLHEIDSGDRALETAKEFIEQIG